MSTRRRRAGASTHQAIPLANLYWMFLRIACTSFGGYMVMISAVQNLVVQRRKLLSDHDVLDGISLASVLPGPVAINVVAYVGYRLRGVLGAAVCVCAAVAPGFALMILFTMAYFHWGHVPAVGKVFMGVVPAVTASIMAAAWNMQRRSVTDWREAVLAVAAAALLLGIGGLYITLAIIAGAAVAGWLCFAATRRRAESEPTDWAFEESTFISDPEPPVSHRQASLLFFAVAPGVVTPLGSLDPAVLLKLLGTFASMSMLLFGGAYVFIPLLQQSVVDAYGWVTQREFVDAVAMGQMMPGPVIVSAAFIGFKVAGLAGAFAATAGIVMPSAMLMVLCIRVLDRVKHSGMATAALRGVRAAVVGMVFAAAISIGKTVVPGGLAMALFVLAFVALVRYRIEAVWIVPVAGLVGFLAY